MTAPVDALMSLTVPSDPPVMFVTQTWAPSEDTSKGSSPTLIVLITSLAAADEAATQQAAATTSRTPIIRPTPKRKQPCRSLIGTPPPIEAQTGSGPLSAERRARNVARITSARNVPTPTGTRLGAPTMYFPVARGRECPLGAKAGVSFL